MVSNLIFSLNATMPIFLMMVTGYILKRIGMLDEHASNTINKLVFRIFLPALLFMDLAKQDFISLWDWDFVLFCALVTVVSIVIAYLMSLFDKDKLDRGEFVQASFRSAAATLGIAFMTNIYDNISMVALMIIGCVPIYNIVSVIVLSITSPSSSESGNTKSIVRRTIKGVVTNPIILSIFVGLLWSVIRLPQPKIIMKSLTYLGDVASPLALIGLGASFEFTKFKEKIGPILLIVFNKLFLFCILFLPVAVIIGFRNDKLVAALIMLGSATTSSSFIMARNMGHRGVISSCAVMITTLLSAFSLTFWLFVLRTGGYI